jgi:glutathione S-transferase
MAPGSHQTPEYRQRHAFERVPCIDHGDFHLYETQAIIRYIDASKPGPSLTPADPKVAARMNQVISIVDWYVFAHGSALTIGFNRVVAPRLGVPVDETAVAGALEKTQHCVDVIAGFLADGAPYLAGDGFTLGDIHAATHLDMLSEAPEGAAMLADTPLTAWLERVRSRPSFTGTTWERLLEAA